MFHNLWWALLAPWRSLSSLGNLTIGALPSMLFWWTETHTVPAVVRLMALVLCFLSSGYSVRVYRRATASGNDFNLPSWRGNPIDLVKAVVAGTLGVSLSLLALAVTVFPLVTTFVFLTTGTVPVNVLNEQALFSLYPLLVERAASSLLLVGLVLAAALTWLVLFVPVMLSHYAAEDRVLSVLDWYTISGKVSRNAGSLLLTLVPIIAVVALLNALFWRSFVALALVGFAADVVAWTAVARIVNNSKTGRTGK